MIRINTRRHAFLGTALAALALGLGPIAVASPAAAQPQAARPSETLNLSQDTGTMVRLSRPMSDVFIANDKIADVQVRSSNQLYIFGKGIGETTVYATDKGGRVVYAANVRVGNNTGSVGEMLRLAMPESSIQATPMNNLLLLTGTVSSPDDAAEAQRLVEAYVGTGTQVVSRLRTATPLQVTLKVKIVEVNRTLVRAMGVNLLSDGGNFLIAQGEGITPVTRSATGVYTGGGEILRNPSGTTLGLVKNLFGLDIISRLQLAETDGMAATLAEPNLTALSGETASFLAGGEFPIPVSQGQESITIEYKQYGVGLAFTPIVLADGRISMRVRPEVSELSSEGAVKFGDYNIPSLTTRRAETTVELGSGQSFMIAGLLRNTNSNSIDKAPFLGDIPILGALFRSTNYRRNETELVIVVTPYLVRPVSGQLTLPSNGYRAPSATDMLLEGKSYGTVAPPAPPVATMAPASGGSAAPGFKM